MKLILVGIDRLNTIMIGAAALMLAGTTLLILVEILVWNMFEASTLIADEYSAYALAAIVFWGAGFTLKENGHIRITLLVNHLPKRTVRWMEMIATLVATIFVAYLVYYLFRMTASAFRYESTSGTLTNTRLWIPQALMLMGAVAFSLQMLACFIRSIQQLTVNTDSPREGG